MSIVVLLLNFGCMLASALLGHFEWRVNFTTERGHMSNPRCDVCLHLFEFLQDILHHMWPIPVEILTM